MKILLISGHGAGDVGACGNGYKEADLTREVVNLLAPKLRQYAEVDVYNQNRNAYSDVCNGNVAINFANYNYMFEVHFNATPGAKGTEIYVTREEKSTEVEQRVMDKLSQFFTVRGVKRKNFAVINYAKNRKGVSSALLETCFIDSSSDIQIYQNNKEAICNAICEGIAEGFELKASESKIEDTTQKTTNEVKNIDIFNDGTINCIYDIQEWLNNKYGFNLALDNKYGPDTHEKLIMALQIELNKQFNAGLEVDGKFGIKTKNACINVRQGSSGNITMLIQMVLFIKGYSLAMDKIFGSDTKAKVMQFQKANGLSVDGIVGKNTFEKLFN